jgi:hypothetical protein
VLDRGAHPGTPYSICGREPAVSERLLVHSPRGFGLIWSGAVNPSGRTT